MSRKAIGFQSIITNPMNVHNFVVDIPVLGEVLSIVVSSAKFPSRKFRDIVLYHQGEEVHYQGLPQIQDHTWQVSLPESDSGVIINRLIEQEGLVYDQLSGKMVPSRYFDVTVTARDLNDNPVFSCILHDCFIQGREPVDMENNDPSKTWNWQYTFIFNDIEDLKSNNVGTPDPHSK